MKDMDQRLGSYERYLKKLLKNYDKAEDVYYHATEENEALLKENKRLRQLAIEKGLDLTQILK